jgi:hypothetical protein
MAEIEKSAFAQEAPEPTEIERITQRIQNFKVGLTPQNAQIVPQILEKGLSNGIFKLNELDSLVNIREEVNRGIIEYNSQVQVAQQRLAELQEEEVAKRAKERDEREKAWEQKVSDERQIRKTLQDKVAILEAKLEALSGIQGNVAPQPVIEDEDDKTTLSRREQVLQDPVEAAKPKPKSKAWEMIRAGRVEKEEQEVINDLGQDLPTLEQIEIPEDAKTVSDFFAEVESVQELADIADKLVDEEEAKEISQTQVESDFKLVDEDEKTKPSFSGPKITGGNAPNIKAVIEEPKNVEAKVDKPIRQFDTEEEMLADAQRRLDEKLAQAEEEETEEVIVPSESDLRAMTKSEIVDSARTLGFNSVISSLTKEKMIDNFLSETEAFITALQESGEFVSATESDTEEKEDGADDIRDGGYF